METAVAAKTAETPPAKLDDVMLAMDIVDTLRHRERLVAKELGSEDREAALIRRLKDIYHAQGIEVPDHILRDGVKALEEKRFVYEPPQGGFWISLAKLYVSRGKWLKPLAAIVGVAAFAAAAWEFGYEAPREAAAERVQVELTETLPAALEAERDAALEIASADEARARIETAYQDGLAAAHGNDAPAARAAVADLTRLKADLLNDLTVRVVSRPGEFSGVYRIPNDAPSARNYYLIVEAIDARGRAHALEIGSEEDQRVARVDRWGVRVPEAVFMAIAADKEDDQIIQNAVVGRKPRGALAPEYDIETAGGAILEW